MLNRWFHAVWFSIVGLIHTIWNIPHIGEIFAICCGVSVAVLMLLL